jgi:nucleoid DNA-binding protein
MTKKDTRLVIKEFLSQAANNTKNGVESHFVGFGKIEIRESAAAIRRNPRTGEPVEVEAHLKPKFDFSGKVKSELRALGL